MKGVVLLTTQINRIFIIAVTTMSIKVRYFASLKEYAERSEDVLETKDVLTARDLWSLCVTDKPLPDNVLVAVNMNYADLDSAVNDGDEVAFFPPVTGGQP